MTEAWGFEAIFAQGCPSVRLSAPTEEPRAVEAARGPPRTAAGGAGRKPRARAAPAAAPAQCAHPGAARPPSEGWEGRVQSQGSVLPPGTQTSRRPEQLPSRGAERRHKKGHGCIHHFGTAKQKSPLTLSQEFGAISLSQPAMRSSSPRFLQGYKPGLSPCNCRSAPLAAPLGLACCEALLLQAAALISLSCLQTPG